MNGAMPVLPLVRLHAMGSDNLVKFEADYLYLFTNRHGVTSKKTPVLYVIVSLRAFPHPYIYICIYIYIYTTRWRSWLTHRDTSRKVAGSIPDVVIGIFH